MSYYAHSLEGAPEEEWQPLEDHLKGVATKAEGLADVFGAATWGRTAGLLHDLGKFTEGFQARLRGGPVVDHASAGAQEAVRRFGPIAGKLLAYTLAGHHGGLPDGVSGEQTDLNQRLAKHLPALADSAQEVLSDVSLPNPPLHPGPEPGYTLSFFTRMVFSCLVDADFLDTEEFLDPGRSLSRHGGPGVDELWHRLEPFLEALQANEKRAPLNQRRNAILRACLEKAQQPQRIYSLTVPTGGGKTISSLAFACRHAQVHGLQRVIYAIPFTSIIDQNAEVFRSILGDEAVLEHHSSLSVPDEQDTSQYERYLRAHLAAQNWDAPLVVTTNVQLFESLFANRPSRCRKLHNIAKSVIILDEAQMLPRQVLLPCLEALRELAANYGCTVVLCTATQPALTDAETFKKAKLEPIEIAPEPTALYEDFRRVQVQVEQESMDSWALAERLAKEEQALCIVNTRRQAREVFQALRELTGPKGVFHLSALMYPRHRSEKIRRIRKALAQGEMCRCISTQLIEAGVDVDFPVVWRAMAGIDSLAQAAGRCNREGRLKDLGQLHVFELSSETGHIPASLKEPIQEGRTVLRLFDDPLSIEAVQSYFENLFWRQRDRLDTRDVIGSLAHGFKDVQFQFAKAAAEFQCFDSPGEAVFVCPEGPGREEIIAGLRHSPNPSKFLRKAQVFTVQLYPHELASLEEGGDVVRLKELNLPVLENMAIYDEDVGLVAERGAEANPADLIV